MRVRTVLSFITLIALLVVAAPAGAAPKKAQINFSATTYSVAENAGTTKVRVLRSGNTTSTATVQLAVDPTTTATSADYSISSPSGLAAGSPVTLTFAPGVTEQDVTVNVLDNTTSDPNKGVVFKLSNPNKNTNVRTPTATLTIVNDDGPGTVDFGSPTYTVVEGAGVATATVKRVGATNLKLSVDWTTQSPSLSDPNPATATTDYTISTGTLTFNPGEMTKTISVPIVDDANAESPEDFQLKLSNPQNLTSGAAPQIGPNSPATVTINDDDVSTYSFSQSLYSVNESAGTATITVNRGGATNVASSVNYATSDGTAAAGADYTATAGTLSFAAGDTQKTFTVPILNDTALEANESINLELTAGTQTLATSVLTIVDNDNNPKPSVQLSDVSYSVTEGSASGVATITVTLDHAADGNVSVNYATADDTALAGEDYTATSGTLTFAGRLSGLPNAGETQKTIQVPIINDDVPEDSDSFDIKLSGVSAAGVLGAPATAAVTITDDDPTGDLEFDNVRYFGSENAQRATVTVHRVGGSNGTVTVDYATSDGTATAPADYADTSGTLTFNPGETVKTFEVPLVWDGQAEGAETVSLALSNPTGGADLTTNNAAVLRIADDGASGPVEFNAPAYTVDENAGVATITVVRSGGSSGGPVTVDYATSDGTASADSDYTATTGTLTFAAGETSRTFQVPLTDDSNDESDETINLTLSNPAGGTTLGALDKSVLTIADDDATAAPAASNPAPTTTADTTTSDTGERATTTTAAAQPTSPDLQSSPAAPNPAGSQTAAADLIAPRLRIVARRIQKAIKSKRIVLSAKCSERCKLRVVAKVGKGHRAITLGKATVKAAAGKTSKVKVKLSKKALAKLAKALRHGKAKVALRVVAADAAGNKTSVVRRITVKR